MAEEDVADDMEVEGEGGNEINEPLAVAAADEEGADVEVPKKKGGKGKATKRKAAAPKGKTLPCTFEPGPGSRV